MKHLHAYLLLFVLLFATGASAQSRVFLAAKDDAVLRIADSTSLMINSSVTMSASGVTISGVNGLDVHPCTGEIYVMLSISGQANRSLATVDTLGNVTIIGNTGDKFASIAFDDMGTLYGVTGDGANTPETLYTLDLSSGTPTFVMSLGNGDQGESIAYNQDDGFLYHWSGLNNTVFERIDLSNNTITNIGFLNPNVNIGNVTASVYAGNGLFGVVNGNDSLFSLTSTGFAVNVNVDMGFPTKGFTFEGIYPALTPLTDTGICPGDSAVIQAYAGSAYQWYRNGVALTGETGQQLSTTSGGVFNCVVTRPGCVDSFAEAVTIIELSAPVVVIQPIGPVGICDGNSTTLFGNPGGISQWFRNGVLLTFETNDSIVVTTPGFYNIMKTNNEGCSDSAVAGVEVFLIPDPIVTIGGDSLICAGDTGTLTTAPIYLQYDWSNGENSQNIEVSAAGVYSVTIIDVDGCTGIDSIEVALASLPTPMLGEDDTLCIGLGGNTTLSPGSFASYLWSDGSTDSMLLVDGNDFDSTSAPTLFAVTVTDASGCEGSDEIEIVGESCVGIEETPDAASIVMYPNPAQDVLRFDSDLSLNAIIVYDGSGRLILEKLERNVSQIDVRALPSGIYTVEVGDGTVKTYKRLVIR